MTEITVTGNDTPATAAAEPEIDPRPRRVRLAGPLAAIGALAAGTLFIALVDPNEPGHYPGCPTKLLSGLDCPGCGGLRATHDLAHGDIAGALDNNALFVVLVPVIIFFLGRNVFYAWQGRRPPTPSPRVTQWTFTVLVAVMLLFTIVRNFPLGAFLASG